MSPNPGKDTIRSHQLALSDRVLSIIEQARTDAVRAVNTTMLLAYWHIGREIVLEIQQGGERALYGKKVIEELSSQLTKTVGKGFSQTNLKLFRQFYLTYQDRLRHFDSCIPDTYRVTVSSPSPELTQTTQIPFPEFVTHRVANSIGHPPGSQLGEGFYSQLSWSHYRALMRVKNSDARIFYEQEAAESVWDKRTLERHIRSQYYERMLKNQQPEKKSRKDYAIIPTPSLAIDCLKDPYVLEFLDLPDLPVLHESHLEAAIISRLQSFLMELGKGFAFVSRQKRLRFDETDLYVDLVFYNCILKCYLLIDLKMGELSHQDVGQMDGYVRMFDDLCIAPDDNPTIGLILCTDKNEAVARYSILHERNQIFASKYMLYLPSEEELAAEILRERRLIEEREIS